MRRIAAPWIFPVDQPPLKNGLVEIDNDGCIRQLLPGDNSPNSKGHTEYYDGLIVPGFVNAHCHLELSHLEGCFEQKRGMGYFLGEINRQRSAENSVILRAARAAAEIMHANGIVAVGDISNTDVTIEVKKNSHLTWFTFIETYGFDPARAEKAFNTALTIWSLFRNNGLEAAVVPHAPYSVSEELFQKLSSLHPRFCRILSIHNMESEAENRFFLSGDGPVRDHLNDNLGLDTSDWSPTGKHSPEYTLPKLNPHLPLLLVHNTYMTPDDLQIVKKWRPGGNSWLVLCPNSNLFIENRLPPVELFRSENLPVCIGTDSLASNTGLSVLEEMKTLQAHFPGIPTEELLTWACLNGARALGMEEHLGSLKPGKKPGIVLITPVNQPDCSLTPESRAIRLA